MELFEVLQFGHGSLLFQFNVSICLEHPHVLGKDSLPKWMLHMTNMAAHRFPNISIATLANKVTVSCLLWYLLASRRLEWDATRFQTTYYWASSVYTWYTVEPNCVWYRLVTVEWIILVTVSYPPNKDVGRFHVGWKSRTQPLPHSAKNPYDSWSTSHSWAHDCRLVALIIGCSSTKRADRGKLAMDSLCFVSLELLGIRWGGGRWLGPMCHALKGHSSYHNTG